MLNFLRIILCLVFLWCFLGCTVGPDYSAPKLYDNSQIEKALSLSPSTENKYSYAIFKDATLTKLQNEALLNSPSVRAAISKVKQARLSVQIAKVKGLPTVDAKGGYQYVNESKNIGYVLDTDIYQAGIDASWELDIFGGIRRRTEASIANARQTIENLNNVYVSLASEVALAYIGFCKAEKDIQILKEELDAEERTVRNNRDLFAAGLVSQDVLNTSKVKVSQTKKSLSSLKNEKSQYKVQLALLTGQLPDALDKLLKEDKKNLVEKPFKFNIDKFYELPAEVIKNRPDVKSAEYALQAQSANIGVAIAELFPKISLSGMLGFEALHAKDLFNHKSYTYSYQPTISVPLFYFGQLQNQVKIEEEAYNEALSVYESTFLSAAAEIKNTLQGLQNAQKQYDETFKVLQETQSLYELAISRYSSGLINQTELLTSKMNLLIALSDWVNANSALYSSVVAFFKSIGSSL